MVAESDIDQQPFQQVKDLMTRYHSSLHNVHLPIFPARRKQNDMNISHKNAEQNRFLTDIYERVPIKVCKVESINCALTPKSQSLISPIWIEEKKMRHENLSKKERWIVPWWLTRIFDGLISTIDERREEKISVSEDKCYLDAWYDVVRVNNLNREEPREEKYAFDVWNSIDLLTATVILPRICSGIRMTFFNIKSNEPPS